jgi:MFS family permease
VTESLDVSNTSYAHKKAIPRVAVVTLASFIALITSGGPLLIYTQSQFLGPMTRDLGWSNARYFLPLSIAGVLACLWMPIFGRMADRYGVRPILLPGIVLFALSYAALGFVGSNTATYAILLAVAMLFQVPHGVLLYTKNVALWRTRYTGLVLAITLAGSAAGGILIPPLADHLIEAVGWRLARVVLGALSFIISFTLAFAFVKPPPQINNNAAALPGSTAGEAFELRHFWLVLAMVGLSSTALNGILGNAVPILVERGATRPLAALGISLVSAMQLVSRLISGMLLDKVQTPLIGLPALLIGFGALALLSFGGTPWRLVTEIGCVGIALGAELELASYFIRRYFGTRSYAQLYGYMLMAYGIGATSGPLILGVGFDVQHSYTLGVALAAALMLLATGCLWLLPSYRYAV